MSGIGSATPAAGGFSKARQRRPGHGFRLLDRCSNLLFAKPSRCLVDSLSMASVLGRRNGELRRDLGRALGPLQELGQIGVCNFARSTFPLPLDRYSGGPLRLPFELVRRGRNTLQLTMGLGGQRCLAASRDALRKSAPLGGSPGPVASLPDR